MPLPLIGAFRGKSRNYACRLAQSSPTVFWRATRPRDDLC